MGSIRTAIELNDYFSSPMMAIVDAANLGVSALDRVSDAMNSNVNTSGLDAAQQTMEQTAQAAQELNDSLQNMEVPSGAAEINIDTSSAEERVADIQQRLQNLITMQNAINQVAQNSYVLPEGAKQTITDVVKEMSRMQAALNYMQENPFELDSSYAVAQMDALEKSIDAAAQKQQELDDLLGNMPSKIVNVDVNPVLPDPLVENPDTIPVEVQPNAPPDPVEIPVTWQSDSLDVFTSTGYERFQQEVQSANSMLNTLNQTQNKIANTASTVDIFSDSAVSDINSLTDRLSAVQSKVEQISNNPVNMGTDAANSGLEQLRSLLDQAIQSQEQLNSAVDDLDVESANSAYLQLSRTISSAEQYIRDNTDAQGEFNAAIEQGTQNSNNLVSALMGLSAVQSVISMVTNQLDAAIDRMDTMTNFSRTMTAITGSADAAEASLAALKETTSGTAYGLDTAASAVQNFVTRGMNISAATEEVGKWADAVAFYGDGTNETLTSVTNALGKMLSKGTVEMENLNTLTDAGINAVGIYAEATGQASSTVQDALSAGKISAEDFITTVSTAFEEGTNGVLSIAGAAKEAGSTWSTSIANMKAAITRGLISVIDSINESLSNAGFGTILDGITAFGQTMETVLGNVGNAIGNVITVLSPVLQMVQTIGNVVANNWSIIAPIVYGIVAALTTYYAIQLAINAVHVISKALHMALAVAQVAHAAATGTLTTATVAQTTAQYGLNTAILSCPVFWIIAAIIALVAVFYAAVAAVNKFADTSVSATGIIAGVFATLGALIANTFITVYNVIAAVVEFLVNVWTNPEYAIKAFIVNVATAFINFALSIVTGTQTAAATVVGIFYALLAVIQTVFVTIYNAVITVIEGIVNLWLAGIFQMQNIALNLAIIFLQVVLTIVNAMSSGISTLVALWYAFVTIVQNVVVSIYNFFASGIEAIVNGWNSGVYNVKSAVIGIAEAALETAQSIASSMGSAASSLANMFVNAANTAIEAINGIITALNNIPGVSISAVSKIGTVSWDGGASAIADTASSLSSLLGDESSTWTAPTLDLSSVSDAYEAGKETGEDLVSGITDSISSTISNLSSMMGDSAETWTADRLTATDIGDAFDTGQEVGADLVSGAETALNSALDSMSDWLGDTPSDYWEAPTLDTIDLSTAAQAGYDWGSNLFSSSEDDATDGLTTLADYASDISDIADAADSTAGSSGDTAGSTSDIADSLTDISDEELKYLRDIAEQETVNRFTTAEITVNQTNNNNISNEMDLDGIINGLTDAVDEAVEIVAEGVHI